ncbi:hypothetical protein VTK26DRAFT_6395 [Humicola hyalothermophila]
MTPHQLPSPDSPATASLRGQTLRIPNLGPFFSGWKRGVNPLYERARLAVDARLERLVADERARAKAQRGDLALLAASWLPDAGWEALEAAAAYVVWLFLWDDGIEEGNGGEGGGGEGEAAAAVAAAEEYCRRSLAFVGRCLGVEGPDGEGGEEQEDGPVAPPTRVCGGFAEAGRRFAEFAPRLDERRRLFGRLREYMEGCVAEYKGRSSGRMPSVEEFYGWRMKTSSVDVMLELCRILNGISLPDDVPGLTEMGRCVNKLLILINELFSLQKELKDGAAANLIPITMHELNMNLESAVRVITDDIRRSAINFDKESSASWAIVLERHGPEAADKLRQLTQAYQAIVTGVLHFSIESPRYGLLKNRQEDGSFVVEL